MGYTANSTAIPSYVLEKFRFGALYYIDVSDLPLLRIRAALCHCSFHAATHLHLIKILYSVAEDRLEGKPNQLEQIKDGFPATSSSEDDEVDIFDLTLSKQLR